MPCRHQLHVLYQYTNGESLSLEDIHPVYRVAYLQRAFEENSDGSVEAEFNKYKEYCGPKVNMGALSLVNKEGAAYPDHLGKPAKERLINWDLEVVQAILEQNPTKNQVGVGLSQIVEAFDEEDGMDIDSDRAEMNPRFEATVASKLEEFSMLSDKSREGTTFVSSKAAYFEFAPIVKELMTAVSNDGDLLKDMSMKLKNLVAEAEEKRRAKEAKRGPKQTRSSEK